MREKIKSTVGAVGFMTMAVAASCDIENSDIRVVAAVMIAGAVITLLCLRD